MTGVGSVVVAYWSELLRVEIQRAKCRGAGERVRKIRRAWAVLWPSLKSL